MHDPNTVAFDMKYPWGGERMKAGSVNYRYRPTFLTIWHVDPERDGSDDSCGWSFVNISREDRDIFRKYAKDEWPFWFAKKYASINMRQCGNLEILALCWLEARFKATGKARHKPLSSWDMAQVYSLMTCPGDNFAHLVQRAKQDEEGLADLLVLTYRFYCTRRRPWYQHPKWHVWHWRFQVHPLEHFKRWAFTRCAGCGKGFKWGDSVYTNGWHNRGPSWFRGEQGAYHRECISIPAPMEETV